MVVLVLTQKQTPAHAHLHGEDSIARNVSYQHLLVIALKSCWVNRKIFLFSFLFSPFLLPSLYPFFFPSFLSFFPFLSLSFFLSLSLPPSLFSNLHSFFLSLAFLLVIITSYDLLRFLTRVVGWLFGWLSFPAHKIQFIDYGVFLPTAICAKYCMNGGTCSGPNTCTCMPDYFGKRCENCKFILP